MKNIFADKNLLTYFLHHTYTIFSKDNNIIKVITFAYVFFFLQAVSYKTFLAVDVEFLIRSGNHTCRNSIEGSYLRFSFPSFAIFFKQVLIVLNGKLSKISKV